MGLDMYAYSAHRSAYKNPDALIDLEPVQSDESPAKDLAYWRKFNALHGWMEDLYRSRGGTGDFNCATVRLTSEDLDKLEDDLNNNRLTPRTGFFFGAPEIYEEDVELTREFIRKARTRLADPGTIVFYDSWW